MAVQEILARGFVVACGGATISGLVKLSLDGAFTKADRTNFTDQGIPRHQVASRTKSIKLTGKWQEDPDNGSRDSGQLACEVLSDAVGPASLGNFTITTPGGSVGTFVATANVTGVGGGNDDMADWTCDLDISGAISWS